MVVGGNDDRYPDSAHSGEVYDLSNCNDDFSDCNGSWISRPNMLNGTAEFEYGSYVNYNDSRGLMLVGSGNSISSKSLINFHANYFEIAQPEMRYSRSGHSSVIIPDGHIVC